MRKIIFLFRLVSLLVLASCGNTTQNNEETVTKFTQTEAPAVFYLYGELMPDDYLDEKDSLLTKPFHFILQRAAYCEVDELLIDSVIQNNRKARKIMNVKYGENWMGKVETSTGKKLLIPFDSYD